VSLLALVINAVSLSRRDRCDLRCVFTSKWILDFQTVEVWTHLLGRLFSTILWTLPTGGTNQENFLELTYNLHQWILIVSSIVSYRYNHLDDLHHYYITFITSVCVCVYFFFLAVQSYNSGPTSWATPPALFMLGNFEIESHEAFAQAGFELWSSWFLPPE
jgi:hypothetical protein